MANGQSWVGASAREIAAAVHRGDTSATSVVVEHVDHARLADRVLDLLGVLRAGAAVVEAEQVDTTEAAGPPRGASAFPLAGVPVLVAQDTPIAGVAGGRHAVAQADHEIVRRLRGAGAVVLGTGRQEPIIGPQTSWFDRWKPAPNPRHGRDDDHGSDRNDGRHGGKIQQNGRGGKFPSPGDRSGGAGRNPWRGDRVAGAGSAAAVAAGVVPIAHAGGNPGSLLVPAASCGLVGFTPGRAADELGAAIDHAIVATTVADAVLGHAVLTGRWPGPGLGATTAQPRLRVAATLRSPVPLVGPDGATRSALRRAARLLISLDHDVVALDPRYPGWLALPGRRIRSDDLVDWRAACAAWFERGGVDLLLLPSLPGPPPPAVPGVGTWLGNPLAALRLQAYTLVWSLAGLPAVTVPMGLRPDGLPGAAQLVGPPGAEALLCAVAAQLERAAPWRRHAPGWPRPLRPDRAAVARSGA